MAEIFFSVDDAVREFRRQAAEWKKEIRIRVAKEALKLCAGSQGDAPWSVFRYQFIFNNASVKPDDMLWHYGISTHGESGGSTEAKQGEEGDYYEFTYRTPIVMADIQELDAAAKEILEELGVQNMTKLEKIHAVYEWLCKNVEYGGADSMYMDQTAYHAIVKRRAVCAGYGLAFCRLMALLGIDARYISGPGRSGGSFHGWNIVELDGRYYNLDATWDRNKERYLYFLTDPRTFTNGGSSHIRLPVFDTPEFRSRYPMGEKNYFSCGTADFRYRTAARHFTFFSAEARSGMICTSWSAVEGAENYILEVYTPSGKWHRQKPRTNLTWTFSSPCGELRGFRIRTDTGVVSEELFMVPEETGTVLCRCSDPSIPWLTFGESPSEGTVSLRWIGSGDCAGYFVYLSEDEGRSWRRVMLTQRRRVTVIRLASGRKYRFSVSAYNAVGKETLPEDSNYVEILVK